MAEAQENCSDIQHLTTREVEALYSSSLFSILHRMGLRGEQTSPPKQQLFLYLQSALDISKENHEYHLGAAEQMEPPLSVLTVTVIGAKGLVPKDSNGKSDPFCMMGCIPSDDRRTGIASSTCIPKDVRPLLLEKHLAAELVQVTSVKRKTLEPMWNESFHFEIESAENNVLQLEVWDHDEETSILETVKQVSEIPNLKSMGRFLKEMAKTSRKNSSSTNDFEGVIVIPLHDIPCNGMEDWFPLQSKSSKKYYGEVKLRLRWKHKNFEHAMHIVTAEQVLQTLWYKCVHYEVSSLRKHRRKDTWNGQLSELGKSLLTQYAVQHDITSQQQSVSQWIACSQPCTLPILEYKVVLSMLQQLSCSSDPVVYEADKPIVRGCIYRFINLAVSRLQKQRVVFPGKDVDALTNLSVLLNCLNETFILDKGLELKLYQAGIKPSIVATVKVTNIMGIKNENTVYHKDKADTCECYLAMKSDAEKLVPEDETCRDVTVLARLTEKMKDYVEKELSLVAHVYKKVVSLDYQDIVHRQLGDLVMHDVRQALEVAAKATLTLDESLDASSSMFQLYQALRAFNQAYTSDNTQDDPTPTAKFYLVFKKTVERWFDVTKRESIERITKAVQLDKMNRMDSNVKHSTSAVDVTGCIKVFSDFWNKLKWPDPSTSYVFATTVTDYICTCGLEYGHLIHRKLTANGFYDTEGRFDVSDQLCIAINNLEEVRQYLANLYEILDLEVVVAALEKEHGEESRMKCERTLMTMLQSADEDMRNGIGQVVCHACRLMKGDVHKCIENVVSAPLDVSADQVVVPILEYLDANVTTLHSYVVENNFKRILGELWLLVMEELQLMVDARKMNLHEHPDSVRRIMDSIKILQRFFNADGNGLDEEMMNEDGYSSLRLQLENFILPTPELIQNLYQAKLLEQEEMEDEPLGRISVRCLYVKKTENLMVQVMNAADLKPLDSNGKSDPYVKVQLKPMHIFPDIPVKKTKVEKATLHPLFDETFTYEIPTSSCLLPGACIQFRVLDKDLLGSDLEGEAFLSLNEVVGLKEKFKGHIDDLPLQSLQLMPAVDQVEASQILETLSCRQSDKEANGFWKGWTKRHKQKPR